METVERLKIIAAEAHDFLVEFALNFKPGIKLTLLARYPECPGADVLVTDDTIPEVIMTMQRLRVAEKASTGEVSRGT